ncbi:hypothetical protein RRF57_008077 [Xylaria bambusicola]|uniref:Uncharacterized protein n=1 Tax=Xylaria bambusicola TaxID=326684 RepID=A0AAN7ZB66_9PEZI
MIPDKIITSRRLNFEVELCGIERRVYCSSKSQVNFDLIAQDVDEIGIDGLAVLDGKACGNSTRRYVYDNVDNTVVVWDFDNAFSNSPVAQSDGAMAAGSRETVLVPEQNAKMGARVVGRHNEATIHISMTPRFVAESLA